MYRFEQNDSYFPVDDYWLFINLVDVHTSCKARFILLHKVDVRGPREKNIHLPKTFSRASKSLSQYSRSDDPFFLVIYLEQCLFMDKKIIQLSN